MTDLLWSDPTVTYEKETKEDTDLFVHNTVRRISFYYTYKAVCDFLEHNDLISIIRGHEVKDIGYQMYRRSHRSKFPSLITVFSAPNYCDQYMNKAVILVYDKGQLNIKVIDLLLVNKIF